MEVVLEVRIADDLLRDGACFRCESEVLDLRVGVVDDCAG